MTTSGEARQDQADKHLLTVAEAAEYCGLSYSYFNRNYRGWHIPYISHGRKKMFRKPHLDAFLKRRTEVS